MSGMSAETVVRRGKNRTLSGFEVETNASWNKQFFFIQAADTQLGLIANYGDGSISDQVSTIKIIDWIKKILIPPHQIQVAA